MVYIDSGLKNTHPSMTDWLFNCVGEKANIPEYMTKEKTTLIQKDPQNGMIPSNYKLITCLPMMWKILTAQIREEIYYSLVCYGLFPEKQKECHKETRGTGDLLYFDQYILQEGKVKQKNLGMMQIDYKKACNIVENVQDI